MPKTLHVFGHQNPDTDTIASAIAWANYLNELHAGSKEKFAQPNRLGEPNRETQWVLERWGVELPALIEDVTGLDVELVDHNEFIQSAKGIENANIKGIIDHHRIAGCQTDKPLYINMEPIGSTASIIYKKYEQAHMTIDRATAGILLSALLSDTLVLTSPTTTDEDKTIAESLAHIAGVDIQTYGKEMLVAGSSLEGYTPSDIYGMDRKKFEFGKIISYVGQVFTFDTAPVLAQKAELLSAMQDYIDQNGATLGVLAITDLETNNSTMIVTGADVALAQKAFNFTGDEADLPGVVSRKSQIVPPLTSAAQ